MNIRNILGKFTLFLRVYIPEDEVVSGNKRISWKKKKKKKKKLGST